MPLYTARQRGADTIRIIEAPTNRAVLLHLAAEMFDVALVKVETVRDDGEEALTRRRPRKADAPAPAEEAAPASGAAETPAPAAASEALIAAEASRVERAPAPPGTALFERMSALARENKEDGE